ncbi:hypothetical protein [Streptomyces sp. NPDC005407]|uniref:hypothetical protein n=1 Tax=Streptomyces sp. NPDC005407 TaxID=3155340 RepID=UPI0033BC0C00
MAAQLCTDLSGVAFVLDEPSAGLHPADKEQLAQLLDELRAAGNTILMIEHDPDLIRRADWVVDIGPRAGRAGGTLVAEGPPHAVAKVPESLTGTYLAGRGDRVRRASRPVRPDRNLTLTDVAVKTVRAARVRIPLASMTCLTGVSGSGKSSLLIDGLARAVQARLEGEAAPGIGEVAWDGDLHWVTVVDQEPIGRTPRSNPATYTKAFNPAGRPVRPARHGDGVVRWLSGGPPRLCAHGPHAAQSSPSWARTARLSEVSPPRLLVVAVSQNGAGPWCPLPPGRAPVAQPGARPHRVRGLRPLTASTAQPDTALLTRSRVRTGNVESVARHGHQHDRPSCGRARSTPMSRNAGL